MSTDVLNVNGGCDNFDVVERELGTLRNDTPIKGNKGTTIIIKPVAIATLLVSIEVYTTKLNGKLEYEWVLTVEDNRIPSA